MLYGTCTCTVSVPKQALEPGTPFVQLLQYLSCICRDTLFANLHELAAFFQGQPRTPLLQDPLNKLLQALSEADLMGRSCAVPGPGARFVLRYNYGVG